MTRPMRRIVIKRGWMRGVGTGFLLKNDNSLKLMHGEPQIPPCRNLCMLFHVEVEVGLKWRWQ